MPDISPEVLVVGDDADILPSTEHLLREVASVTALMPPRLALVRPLGGAELPSIAGLTYGRGGVVDLPPDLTDAELLFVDAWRARSTPKTRRGDGLAWDSPGFEPPDLPRVR